MDTLDVKNILGIMGGVIFTIYSKTINPKKGSIRGVNPGIPGLRIENPASRYKFSSKLQKLQKNLMQHFSNVLHLHTHNLETLCVILQNLREEYLLKNLR